MSTLSTSPASGIGNAPPLSHQRTVPFSISKRAASGILLALTAIIFFIASAIPRIPQPLSYHLFADDRTFLGIPNFGDVASNLPFAAIGICGLFFLLKFHFNPECTHFRDHRENWPYSLFFTGLLLVAFGSSWYHLAPNNHRLVWDRLPMTITFMSLVAAIIAERIDLRLGLWLLPVLLLLGIASVVQWIWSEERGAGDLRFYAAVQAYSALVLLLAFVLPKTYTRNSDLWLVLGFYVLAKVLELLDTQIFSTLHIVSGHTLKHLAAAASGYFVLRMLQKRQPLAAIDPSNLCSNGAQQSCLTTNRS